MGLEFKEFNFSSDCIIHYNKDLKQIEYISSDLLPSNFWGGNIRGVTGVVGKNGTGKTTLMRALLRSCIDGGLSEDPENVIVAFKERSNSKKISLYIHQSIEVTNIPEVFEIVDSPRLSNCTFIYHSNHFDPYEYPLDLTKDQLMGMKNLGTNYLLVGDKETYLNRDKNDLGFTYKKTLAYHRVMELRRQVNFIRKYKNNHDICIIKIPRYLRISPNNEEEEWLCSYGNEEQVNFCLKMSKLFNDYQNQLEKNKRLELIEFKFFRSSIFNIINYLGAVSGLEYDNEKFSIQLLEGLNDLLLKRRSIGLKDFQTFYNNLYQANSYFPFLKANADDLLELLKIIEKSGISDWTNDVYIDLQKNEITAFNKFFNSFFSEERITSFVNFGLSHEPAIQTTPSSGEMAFFNLFSRFVTLKKSELSQNLIILLDEVELALHPEWQQSYIDLVLNFLKAEFSGSKRKVQLIITSHSPFIVSDLPKCCINFLDGEMKLQQTFGANIHSLFMDAFFMGKGLIGQFAQNKIFEILNEIETSSNLDSEKDSLEKQIRLIGEPMIQKRLLETLFAKLPQSDLEIKRRALLHELNLIESQITNLDEKRG
ncbi:MAG TPA: AAA family ATPase [Prolixibacteraceae bacterium]|nr:AAA family ATPase [Prolixibacteraceae bacterium]